MEGRDMGATIEVRRGSDRDMPAYRGQSRGSVWEVVREGEVIEQFYSRKEAEAFARSLKAAR
jgi:hypothetical protein